MFSSNSVALMAGSVWHNLDFVFFSLYPTKVCHEILRGFHLLIIDVKKNGSLLELCLTWVLEGLIWAADMLWIMVTLGTRGVNDDKSPQLWLLWSDSCPKQLFYKSNMKNVAQPMVMMYGVGCGVWVYICLSLNRFLMIMTTCFAGFQAWWKF